jgi:hypothetical protein
MQMDFGQIGLRSSIGRIVTLYFVTFVLAHSRHKYVEWLDRPFTTRDLINAHENAFEYYGGMTKEIVYDQDHLILVINPGMVALLMNLFSPLITHSSPSLTQVVLRALGSDPVEASVKAKLAIPSP